MNELHASGAFYSAQLTRFKCEHCAQPAAFLVEMFSRDLGASLSCCAECAGKLKKLGWLDTVKEYERKLK